MTIARINPGNWAFGATLSAAEANGIDTNVTYALDRRTNKTDTLSSTVSITKTGANTPGFAFGANTFISFADATCSISGAATCTAGLTWASTWMGFIFGSFSFTSASISHQAGSTNFSNNAMSLTNGTVLTIDSASSIATSGGIVFSGAASLIGSVFASNFHIEPLSVFFFDATSALHVNGSLILGPSTKVTFATRTFTRPLKIVNVPSVTYQVANGFLIYQLDVSTGDAGVFVIDLPQGAIITNISMYVVGAFPTHSALPVSMPQFYINASFYATAGGGLIAGPFIDSSATVFDYENNHYISSGALSIPVDNIQYLYSVVFKGEFGTNSMINFKILNCQVTYTSTSMDDSK